MKISDAILFQQVNLFAKICLAALVDDLKAKHPSFAAKIDFLASQDPSPNKKLLPYATKVLVSGQALENEIADVIKLFYQFSHRLDKRDINQWTNFTELRDKLFEIRDFDLPSKSQKKKELKKEIKKVEVSGAETLFEDEQCKLVFVANKAQACFLGKGTRWCITMENQRYFEDYSANNVVFYYVLRKDLPPECTEDKVAISVPRDKDNKIVADTYDHEPGSQPSNIGIQFWSTLDQDIPPADAFAGLKAASNILSIVKQDAPKRPMGFLAKLQFKPETITSEEYAKNMSGNEQEIAYKTIDPKVLAFLSKSEDTSIRFSVAKNKATPIEILKQMATDPSVSIRGYVAQNENASPELLAQLSKDPHPDVRFSVAANHKTPPQVIADLANLDHTSNSISLSFLPAIARNPSTPSTTLHQMVDGTFRDKYHSNDSEQRVEELVAQNPNTAPETLAMLSAHNKALSFIALNPKAPPEVLDHLAKDEYSPFHIKLSVAKNPSTSSQTLADLTQPRHNIDWRARGQLLVTIKQNPNASPELIQQIEEELAQRALNPTKRTS